MRGFLVISANSGLKVSAGAENAATVPLLNQQLSNESLVAAGTNINNVKVTAQINVNG